MTQEKIDQSAPISTDELRNLLDAATPGPWNVTAPVEGSHDFRVIKHGPYGFSECGKYMVVSGHVSEEDASLIAIAPQLAAEVLALRADLAAPSAPAEVEGLVVLRKAADAATGDPARYPRRGIIDRYQSEVVAAYENGDLVASTAMTALQAENDRLANGRDAWKADAEALAAELENCLTVFQTEDKRFCCDGRMCGCYGATEHSMAEHFAREALAAHAHNTEGDPGVLIDDANASAEKAEVVADQLADALHHMVNASLHPDQFADEALAAYAKLKGEV